MRIFWLKYKKTIPGAVILLLLTALGCGTPPERADLSEAEMPIIRQDGIELPRFITARDQLNYAKSGFNDLKKKRAAFRAVLTLFPNDRNPCGHAAAGLAYLFLEPDYRFAGDSDIRQAINGFSEILEVYPDQPDVSAKGRWYLGWIHTDLLRAPDRGIPHFLYIADHFARIPMRLSVPVPWANLVSPAGIDRVLTPAIPEKYWGEIALLEVIRNAESGLAARAFDRLFETYPTGYAAGFALKAMLEKPESAGHALPRVDAYLSRPSINPYLANRIRHLAGRGRH